MIKGLIFDAYGTLLDTADGSVRATRTILKINNASAVNAEHFYQRWKQYHKLHIDKLKSFVKEEEIFLMDLIALFREYQIEGDPQTDVQIMLNTLGKRNTFPETNTVLNALRPKYDLFVGSVSDQDPLSTDITRNGINVNKYFSSEYLRVYKPKSEFYEKILKEIKMRPDEVVFIGDSIIDDILGPSSLDITTVWVNRKRESVQAEVQLKHEIENLWPLINMEL